jgi:ABC-type iron transport system FetAB ATPase subunit
VAPAAAVARKLDSIEAVEQGLASVGYIPNRQISTAVYLAQHLQKPILVEGPAGVGKTELAKSVAAFLDLTLIPHAVLRGAGRVQGAIRVEAYAQAALYTQILKDKIGDVIGATDTAGRARQAACVRRHLLLAPVPEPARCCARCSSLAARCC